jgi:hypothetical protein
MPAFGRSVGSQFLPESIAGPRTAGLPAHNAGVIRRLSLLAAAGLLSTACFGKFALGVTQTIEPTPIFPGASVKQEVNVEADGLLGSAVKQAMTDAAAKGQQQSQSGTKWQVRDNSDGSAVHLRMSRTVSLTEAQTAVPQSSTGGFDVGTVSVRADDWVLARRYAVRVVVAPSAPTAPTGTPSANDAAAKQLAQAILAGITYDYYLSLPGVVTATNGLPADQSRLVWHLDLTTGTERVLTAESIYPDVPRIVVLLVGAVLIIGAITFRSRFARRAEPPVESIPPQP